MNTKNKDLNSNNPDNKALSGNITIIDPHVHFWHPTKTPRAVTPLVKALGFNPWLLEQAARMTFPKDALNFYGTPKHILRPYLTEEYSEDSHQQEIAGIVHVEAGWKYKKPIETIAETTWIDSLSKNSSVPIKAIVAQADFSLGKSVDEILEGHLKASKLVRGIRQVLFYHKAKNILSETKESSLMRNSPWLEGFKCLAKHRLHFETACYSNQLDDLSELAKAYPETKIILCHIGTPIGVGGPFGNIGLSETERNRRIEQWKDALGKLSQNKNVYIKLSGFGMPVLGFGYEKRKEKPEVNEITESISPFINFVIETMGAQRCMFASNFPVDKVSFSFSNIFNAYMTIVSDKTDEEINYLFSETAKKIYGIAL